MKITISYTAMRMTELSAEETGAIETILRCYSVESAIEEFEATGEGLNWEPFNVHPEELRPAPEVVFDGATFLPDNSVDALWLGLQHWCRALSEIRNEIPGADWLVQVGDRQILWDDRRKLFDPAAE